MSPTRTPHSDLCSGADLSLAETTHRLRAEFTGVLDPATITRVVRACHRDLAGAPAEALPELVERLARVDLTDLIGAEPAPSRGRGVGQGVLVEPAAGLAVQARVARLADGVVRSGDVHRGVID